VESIGSRPLRNGAGRGKCWCILRISGLYGIDPTRRSLRSSCSLFSTCVSDSGVLGSHLHISHSNVFRPCRDGPPYPAIPRRRVPPIPADRKQTLGDSLGSLPDGYPPQASAQPPRPNTKVKCVGVTPLFPISQIPKEALPGLSSCAGASMSTRARVWHPAGSFASLALAELDPCLRRNDRSVPESVPIHLWFQPMRRSKHAYASADMAPKLSPRERGAAMLLAQSGKSQTSASSVEPGSGDGDPRWDLCRAASLPLRLCAREPRSPRVRNRQAR
jgi:hypothetical protein